MRYRYNVVVIETVEHRTAVESDVKLGYGELMEEVERRRVDGKLSLAGVKDVDTYIDKVFEDGKEMHDAIFAD